MRLFDRAMLIVFALMLAAVLAACAGCHANWPALHAKGGAA